jgi:two-component system NtrC family response regulator
MMITLPSPENLTILLVEDDAGLRTQMQWALAPRKVITSGCRSEALSQFRLAEKACHIALLDLGLPPDCDGASEGLATLTELLSEKPRTKVIVLSGNGDRANAVKATGLGAFDFIPKPVDMDLLCLIIDRAARMYTLEEENAALREYAKTASSGLVFGSRAMTDVQRMIERLGPRNVSVLIQGESGTGKEIAARLLHEHSPRRSKAFVAINCASIPDHLLESELFGHEKGAFTGALKQTPGKFELADGGTLFLDEIGDMPLALQAKLLRFLQTRELERVGGRAAIKIDVRVISATNRDLEELVQTRQFREDLYYRLNEVGIKLPPLRERERDAIALAHHFLNVNNRINGRNIRGFSADALAAIAGHPWPGNVRELENRLKRAVVMTEGTVITAADLDLAPRRTEIRNLNLKLETEKLEQALLQEALAAAGGNISLAAKLMGVSRPYVYSLKRQAGL